MIEKNVGKRVIDATWTIVPDSDLYAVQIVAQSHTGNQFTPIGKDQFNAQNGIRICSRSHPSFGTYMICVRGCDSSEDNAIFFVPGKELRRVRAKIKIAEALGIPIEYLNPKKNVRK